jgi:aminopeptidase N
MTQISHLSLEENYRSENARLRQLRFDEKRLEAALAAAKDELLSLYAKKDSIVAEDLEQLQHPKLQQAQENLARAKQAKEKTKKKWEKLTGRKWDDRNA